MSLYTVQDYLVEYPFTEEVTLHFDAPSGQWVAMTAPGSLWQEDELVICIAADPISAMTALLAAPAYSEETTPLSPEQQQEYDRASEQA